MSIKKQVEDTFGLEAFKAALAPQEGSFNRRATVILNKPKDLSWKSGGAGARDNERVAQALLDRNALGQFVKREDKDGASSTS